MSPAGIPYKLSTASMELVSADSQHAVTICGPLTVAIWRGEATAVTVRRAHDALRKVIQTHPGEAISVNVAEEPAPIPRDEAREAFARMLRSSSEGLLCAAVVGEGDSFALSVVRTVVAGLMLLVRPGAPLKVFGTVPEAAAWIASQRPPRSKFTYRAPDIEEAIEASRRMVVSTGITAR